MTVDTFSTGGRPAGDGHSADALDVGGTSRATACCVPRVGRAGRAPLLPAGTAVKRRVDRLLPRWGWPAVAYFAAVAGLFGLAQNLPAPAYLAVDAAAFAAGGIWCALNFWRGRQAHCLLTGSGWLLLALFAAAEAGVGHSLISGDEQLVFLAILAIGLGFEAFWYLTHRSPLPPAALRGWPAGPFVTALVRCIRYQKASKPRPIARIARNTSCSSPLIRLRPTPASAAANRASNSQPDPVSRQCACRQRQKFSAHQIPPAAKAAASTAR